MIVAASNNGGRYNMVHRQTDDGIVISVISGNSLLPLTFTYKDYAGCTHTTLLSGSPYYHRRLMRGDCGWREEHDSAATTFSWETMMRVIDDFSDAPNGEYTLNWHYIPNCAKDAFLDVAKSCRTVYYRKDREYWTPDHVLQGDTEEDIFGPEDVKGTNPCCKTKKKEYTIPTFKQWNPITCEPRKPNKCGRINYKEKKCHK